MSWRPHPKRARTNSRWPEAWGTSDRSGFIGNQKDLLWQLQWGGTKLINFKILVYPDEYDIPQEQLKAIILPPDPLPVLNSRPEQYVIDEVWEFMMEESTVPIAGYRPGFGGGIDGATPTPLVGGAMPIYLEQSTLANSGQPTMAMALEISTPPQGTTPQPLGAAGYTDEVIAYNYTDESGNVLTQE